MQRRSFLQLFGVAAVAAVADPERLFWQPGAKSYFDLWTPPPQTTITLADGCGNLSVGTLLECEGEILQVKRIVGTSMEITRGYVPVGITRADGITPENLRCVYNSGDFVGLRPLLDVIQAP